MRLRPWLQAVRPHQWLKNLLLALPLLGAQRFDAASLTNLLMAILTFSLAASSVYLINDILDREDDRQHLRKRHRPFARGALRPGHGWLVAGCLAAASVTLAAILLPAQFLAGLLVYGALTTAYSFGLKQRRLVDVFVLASLFTLRIVAGGLALEIELSFWLMAFSMFFFLSLAMVKRHTELSALAATGKNAAAGRGYLVEDLHLLNSMGPASGYLAVLVFALYINEPSITPRYTHPEALWLICPLMLYWVSRIWLISHRGQLHDDPVVYAIRDRVSLGVGALCAACFALAL